MIIAQFNNLYFYFFCAQLIFVPVYFYHTPLISDAINLNKAIWMHMIGVFWSAVGFLTVKLFYSLPDNREWQNEDKYNSFTNTFYVYSYLIIIIGTAVAILQVVLFVPLTEYATKLLSSDYEIGIRDAFLLPSDEEGLSGIIKMFSYAPLSIYLMSLGIINFIMPSEVDKRRLWNLNITALVAIVIKVFFSLDRLTIMTVLLANIFLVIKKGYINKIRYWIFIALALLLANYLSIKRLENVGIIDFTLLYFKSGLVNFQLMIDTCDQYTYGFSTILAPLYFIFRFFHLSLPDFQSNYEWEWNPAQYFSSYAFQDFGYFYFIAFYFVGMLLYIIDDNTRKRNIYSSATYFVVLYGAVSFVFVPVIRGIDFWFSLLLPLILVRLFSKSLIRLNSNCEKSVN